MDTVSTAHHWKHALIFRCVFVYTLNLCILFFCRASKFFQEFKQSPAQNLWWPANVSVLSFSPSLIKKLNRFSCLVTNLNFNYSLVMLGCWKMTWNWAAVRTVMVNRTLPRMRQGTHRKEGNSKAQLTFFFFLTYSFYLRSNIIGKMHVV